MRSRSGLLPRQIFHPPARDRVAMMAFVERPFEAVEHVIDLAEACLLERLAGADRALAASADDDHRAIDARNLAHLTDEVRIDLPVGTVVPRHEMRADRVADKEVLDLAATVDQHRIRVLAQKVVRLSRFQMFHGENCTVAIDNSSTACENWEQATKRLNSRSEP